MDGRVVVRDRVTALTSIKIHVRPAVPLSSTYSSPSITSAMASSTSNDRGKQPVRMDDDSDVDDLDGADFDYCNTGPLVIPRPMHTVNRCTRRLYPELLRET